MSTLEDRGANSQRAFWTRYYQEVFTEPNTWLDYSNEAVQAQTFGVAIETAGPIIGRRCLDVGCGRGTFSLHLAACDACGVVGIDVIADGIDACRRRHPNIRWEVGSPEDETFCQSLGEFDIIFLLEVLQYVSLDRTLGVLWKRLHPGGRLVAVVPNKDDPIVQKSMARFGGYYLPPNLPELKAVVTQLPAVECWACRGMTFQADQRLVPYAVSPWTISGKWDLPPNRLVFAVLKQAVSKREQSPAERI
jgi:2-polyprenyl-3-methyl-5-hydroxy-6-metoxy-1,4-benzoquinol methylase